MCIVAAILMIMSAAGYSLLLIFSLAVSEILNAVFLLSIGVFIFSLKRKVNTAVDEVENYFGGEFCAYANVPNGYAAYCAAQAAPAPRYSTPAAPQEVPAAAVKTAETAVPASPAAAASVRDPAPERMQNSASSVQEVGKAPQNAEASPSAQPAEEKHASSPYIQIERNR